MMEIDCNATKQVVQNNNSDIKVHASMCMVLKDVLKRVMWILPAIESARPGSRPGIQELCSINHNIEKGNLIIRNCTESSKLYMAITGETTLKRCETIRSSLHQSLCLIQSMVPTILAAQIVEVIDCISDAKFTLNPFEEEAGKLLLQSLCQRYSIEELEFENFQLVASKLSLTNPKSILIERRSIKKMLKNISEGKESKKESVLKIFLHIIKKYAQCPNPNPNSTKPGNKVNEPVNQAVKLNANGYMTAPPLEFICPISSKLMHDPVIIASSQTFEREYIEKWFEEGNDTCPITKTKLDSFVIIRNSSMRDLIANWRKNHRADDSQPNTDWSNSNSARDVIFQEKETVVEPNLTLQSQYSISSLNGVPTPVLHAKAENIMFQRNHSNDSFISSDASYVSESSGVFNGTEGLDENLHGLFPWSDDFKKYGSFCKFDKDMFAKFLFDLSQLELEVQTKAVEEFRIVLNGDDESYNILFNGFLEAIIEFLKSGCDQSDLKIGVHMLLSFLSNSRVDVLPFWMDDLFNLVSSLLETNSKQETLLILEILTKDTNHISDITESNLVLSLMQLLQTEEEIEYLEQVLKILSKISNGNQGLIPRMFPPNLISKISLLLDEESLSLYCLNLLSSLSHREDTLELIISTCGCLESICEVLDTGSPQKQDYSLNILLNICASSYENCLLEEGVIPALVGVSVNGSEEGKANATKLLNLLRDSRSNNNSNESPSGSGLSSPIKQVSEKEMGLITDEWTVEKRPVLKSSPGFFARKIKRLSKPARW